MKLGVSKENVLGLIHTFASLGNAKKQDQNIFGSYGSHKSLGQKCK
jgi:hypothetical protein